MGLRAFQRSLEKLLQKAQDPFILERFTTLSDVPPYVNGPY